MMTRNIDVIILALTRIAVNPSLLPEGNAKIAIDALKEYWNAQT